MGVRKRKATGNEWASAEASSSTVAGPSSNPIVIDSPVKAPPAKRQRHKKDTDVPIPEKRGAVFKKRCPKNILDRLDRVFSQRFFMVDRRRVGSELREEFSVLGSTGNVYTVVIDNTPSCNCPDAIKGNHCKHILFIFLKVLQVTQDSGHWYQKALLTSELEDIFAHAPLAPNSVAHPRIKDAYARATGKAIAQTSEDDQRQKKRIPGPDDDCPICYENMHGASESILTFCEECGNGLHKECFRQWATTARYNLTCVFCRAKWVVAPASGSATAGPSRSVEGYLNLGGVAGVSPVRDTSSYYHGPKKGKHYYGYQEHSDYR
ncbi:hypothetical protein AcV5_006599 [Taiwanofungus camphoratus]|nr:hypothetical protein AcV5_006599 [Antrodia cinnamomea]